MDDDAFLRLVTFPDLKKLYDKRIKETIKEVNVAFRRDFEQLKEEHEYQIKSSRDHDQVVNLCVYPFVERDLPLSRLGYRFLRAAPLLELGVKNIDFLIYRQEGRRPIAIFGEAKSSIANYARTLNEVAERRRIIESNLGYIKTEYMKTGSDPILEHVLAVKSIIGIDTRDAILEGRHEVILWLVDFLERKLRLGQPPEEEPARHLMMHHDEDLTRFLSDGVLSNAATFAFYPQSHTVSKLKAMLQCLETLDRSLVVPIYRLSQFIDTQLFYLNDAQKTVEVDIIVREAEKIAFAVKFEDKPVLRIISRYRKLGSLEAELQSLWLKTRMEEIRVSKVDEARTQVQNEIIAEQKSRPTLI